MTFLRRSKRKLVQEPEELVTEEESAAPTITSVEATPTIKRRAIIDPEDRDRIIRLPRSLVASVLSVEAPPTPDLLSQTYCETAGSNGCSDESSDSESDTSSDEDSQSESDSDSEQERPRRTHSLEKSRTRSSFLQDEASESDGETSEGDEEPQDAIDLESEDETVSPDILLQEIEDKIRRHMKKIAALKRQATEIMDRNQSSMCSCQ